MTDKKVGYGLPPVEHQFKPGKSGNPRGRPVKRERSATLRQFTRDVLEMMDSPITMTIDGKPTKVTAHEALLRRHLHKAIKEGHGPSLRFWHREIRDALQRHEADNDFKFLEMVERDALNNPVPPENERSHQKLLNQLRRQTKSY